VYALAREYVAHTDSRFDPATLEAFVAACADPRPSCADARRQAHSADPQGRSGRVRQEPALAARPGRVFRRARTRPFASPEELPCHRHPSLSRSLCVVS
jgi:hypothetical protein